MSAIEDPEGPLPARRVRGPAAVSGDWNRFVNLAGSLALMDWKLRYFGSALGYLWSLLRPLMLFGILYLVFSQVLRVGSDVPDYPLQLLIGVLLFTYFSEVTSSAVTSLVDEETLVRKIAFPRAVIPVSVALTASFNLALNLFTVGLFVILGGVSPRVSWLFVPVPLALLVVIATAMGMLLSVFYVSFRDIKPIWDVLLQALFYITPIFYPVQLLLNYNRDLAHVAMANPVAALVQETRHLILGDAAPSAGASIGSDLRLLIPAVLLVAITLIGFLVFRRLSPTVAEEL